MLNVVGGRQKAVLASISYRFDGDREWAWPFLDPLNPQSIHAGSLLALVELALTDLAYVARLEAHYQQVRDAAADPSYPIQELLVPSVDDWVISLRPL